MKSRILGTALVFAVLLLAFSGLVGFTSAAAEDAVFVPEPRIGDSAFYSIKEVRGPTAEGVIPFDWVRTTWHK